MATPSHKVTPSSKLALLASLFAGILLPLGWFLLSPPSSSTAALTRLDVTPDSGRVGDHFSIKASSLHCGVAEPVTPTPTSTPSATGDETDDGTGDEGDSGDSSEGGDLGEGAGSGEVPTPVMAMAAAPEGPFSVYWDADRDRRIGEGVTTAAGMIASELPIPASRPGQHSVWGRCDEKALGGMGTITVLHSITAEPIPSSGRAGEPVTLEVEGLYCVDPGEDGTWQPGGGYDVVWSGAESRVDTYDSVGESDFAATPTAPEGIGAYSVHVRCAAHPELMSSPVAFEVEAASPEPVTPSPVTPSPVTPSPVRPSPITSVPVTPSPSPSRPTSSPTPSPSPTPSETGQPVGPVPPPGPPRLALHPSPAWPGRRVTITAIGFPVNCGGYRGAFDGVRLTLRDLVRAAEVHADFAVPSYARSGGHRVRLECDVAGAARGFAVAGMAVKTIAAEATLEVVDGPAYRSTIAAALASPRDIDLLGDVDVILFAWIMAVVLALAVMLPVYLFPKFGFPPDIFNRSVEELRDEKMRLRRWDPWKRFALFALVSAIALTIIDDDFWLDEDNTGLRWAKVLVLFAAFLMATVATTLTYGWVADRRLAVLAHRDRIGSGPGVLRTMPVALAIAGICAVVSWRWDFHPGYAYGLIAGFVVAVKRTWRDAERERWAEGQSVLAGAIATLCLALLVWLVWAPVDSAVETLGKDDTPTGLLLLDMGLAAFALTAFSTVVFALLPLHLMDGVKLMAWSKKKWWAVFLPTSALFGYLTLKNNMEELSAAQIRFALVVFLVFFLISMITWLIARRHVNRRDRANT